MVQMYDNYPGGKTERRVKERGNMDEIKIKELTLVSL